jgi:PAS domain S-box-containing protein
VSVGHGRPVETRLQRKDGRPVWVEILARWTREADEDLLMLTLVDITQRKSAEEERERLIAAVEQVPEAILITDQDRRILYANRAFELIFGYDRRQAIGHNLRSLLAAPRTRGAFAHVQEALQRGETWKGVVGNRTASGEEVEMETSVTPIVGEDGRLRHIVYVKRDVTQERRMERQLRQTQKLQAIGTLAGGIAHDFNNILSAILGSAQLALLMSEGNDRLRRPLERILQASQRASDMVRQILTFSRSEEKPFDNIHLLSVLEEALQLLRSSLPATIRMETQLEVGDDGVFGDATQLHQVIMNLCTNAAHAMKDGHGLLEVKLSEKKVSSRFQAEALGIAPGDYLCLSVRDTGVGIPPDIADRIFEPFFTTKAAGEGTGLGLSVVHGIVRSHGGGIEVQSRLGEGSVFRVYLPKSAGESAEKVDRTESCQIGPKRILVVDDEEMIREVTAEFLEADRHQAITIGSPLDALSMLSDGAAPFDLLVVDHTMPDMTGLKFLEEVRGLGISAPAVLCSGNVHGLSPSVRSSLGIRAVLQKPFSLEQLRAVLAEVFGGESLGQARG